MQRKRIKVDTPWTPPLPGRKFLPRPFRDHVVAKARRKKRRGIQFVKEHVTQNREVKQVCCTDLKESKNKSGEGRGGFSTRK